MAPPSRFSLAIVPSRLVVLGVGTTMVVLCVAGILILWPGIRARDRLADHLQAQLAAVGTRWEDHATPTPEEVDRALIKLSASAGAISEVENLTFIAVDSGQLFTYDGDQTRSGETVQDPAVWLRLRDAKRAIVIETDHYRIYQPLAIPGHDLAVRLTVSQETFARVEAERRNSLIVGGLILSTLGGTLLMLALARGLEESRRELELVLESTQAPMLMVDNHQRIVFVNRPGRLLLGKGRSERLAGLPLLSVCPSPETGQFFTSLLLQERPSEDELHTTLPGYTQDAVFRAHAVPVRTAVGRTLGTLLVLRNVTLEKRLEDRRVSQTIHELKGMLGEASGFIRQVLTAPPADRADDKMYLNLSLEKLQHCYVTVASMVRNIASAFMPEQLELHQRHHDLGELVRQSVDSFRAMLPTDSPAPTVTVTVPEHSPTVYCDGEAIGRIMMNLLRNALQHCPRGEIRVRVFERGNRLQVEVTDTGRGIAPEHLPRVFEPHESFHSGGMGMGLSVCRDFVRAHGGEIWAESDGRGRGATFAFTLAKSQPVIIATDAAVIGHLKARCVELGYDPTILQDLLSVVKQVGELHPNFVLLDVDLRDTLTGPSLAYRLKRSDAVGRVPIVAVAEDLETARTALAHYEGLEMDAFLTRSCDTASFTSVVQIMAAYWYVAQPR